MGLVSPKCILNSFSCKINAILRSTLISQHRSRRRDDTDDDLRSTRARLSYARKIQQEQQQHKQQKQQQTNQSQMMMMMIMRTTESFENAKNENEDQVCWDRSVVSSDNLRIHETRLGENTNENKNKNKAHQQQQQQQRRVPKRLWTDCEHQYKSFNSKRNKFVLL